MYTDKQTVNGEEIRSLETATHYVGILQLSNAAIHSHIVELNRPGWFTRIQVDGILWNEMRSRDSRKSPKVGILYDDDALHGNGPIPMCLAGWSDGDSITPKMAIFGRITNGAFLSPTTFYTLTRGGLYTGV